MISPENNLDWIAAKHAQDVIRDSQHQKRKDVENTVTKALGVLQENGVYACFLYILAKEKPKEKPSDKDKNNMQKSTGEVLVEYMLKLLDSLNIEWGKPNSYSAEDVLSYIVSNENITLERLLLTKETLEQMLIYARYGAKARPDDKKQKDEQETTS
jgi:hypothetical protein